jgi:hypothetical protein
MMNVLPQRGDWVVVRTASGGELSKRALTTVTQGNDFPVVWVARPDEYLAAEREGREAEGVPWPAEDVWIENEKKP